MTFAVLTSILVHMEDVTDAQINAFDVAQTAAKDDSELPCAQAGCDPPPESSPPLAPEKARFLLHLLNDVRKFV